MKGAVAAGHPATATAGAQILAQGGNAVDACIAAGFVSWVAESPLAGPGAGGFMLVHRASDRADRLLDFFVALPGRGLEGATAAPMDEIEVPFDEQTRSEEHTSELQSPDHLVCRLLLEKKKKKIIQHFFLKKKKKTQKPI